MTKEEIFWKWFKDNESKYFYLDQMKDEAQREQLLDVFLDRLHKYCSNLYFQIGNDASDHRELIISAEGNVEYFDEVEQLVSAAPKIKNWEIIAFKPPMDINFVHNYEGVKIDVPKLYFMPLENEESPESLGLRIYFNNYVPKKVDKYLEAAYQILDTIIGEKANTINIQHVEVAKLPIKKENLYSIKDLSGYISWRKTQKK